jgi:hypothetical protein
VGGLKSVCPLADARGYDPRRAATNGCSTGSKGAQVFADLVAHVAKERQAFLFGALEGGGVFEGVMKRDGSGKERAVVFGVIANCEDVIELFALKLVHVLGTMGGNVDAQLAHDGDCFGANMAWVGSGTEDFEAMARVVA